MMPPGAIVWFTGLPASGKTTLAHRVRARLPRPAILLDSDELRVALAAEDYAAGDRDAFYRAVAGLAVLLARQGFVVLVAATAPRRAHREAARADDLRFLEVWVRTPRATCEQRDRKGLYARAHAGGAPDLPGVGVAYEPPLAPAVTADGGHDDAAVATLLRVLEA